MIYMYWEGTKYPYIKLCHDSIRLHNTEVELLTPESVKEHGLMDDYINDEYYHRLMPAHRADLIRIRYLKTYGGMWIDSDFIALHSFSNLIDISNRDNKFFYYCDDFQATNGILISPRNHSLMLEWDRNNQAVFANLKRMDKIPSPSDLWCSFGADQLKVLLETAIEPTQNLTRRRIQPISYFDRHMYFNTHDLKGNAWPAAYGYMLFNTGFPRWIKEANEDTILNGPWLISYLFRLALKLERH